MIEQTGTGNGKDSRAIDEVALPQGRPVGVGSGTFAVGGRVVSSADWAVFKEQAHFFVKSNLLANVQSVEAALTIMVTGYELGIGPMQALRLISVVKGKPVCAAELMAALCYRDHGDEALTVEESTAERCTVSYKRRGWERRRTHTFTMKDAQTAGLAQRDTWKTYPAAMLRARCISAVARMAFPDTISGLYTPEEIAPEAVRVTSEGELVYNEPPEPAPPAQARAAPASSLGRLQATPENAAPAGKEQLAARIRTLAGDSLPSLQQWADLAKTYGQQPVPYRWSDMNERWLRDLYQAIVARRLFERLRSAPNAEAASLLMAEALQERARGEISDTQYDELDKQATRRCAQLETAKELKQEQEQIAS